MELRCPYCGGGAFVMVTSSDGATVTVCTRCNEPVPFEAPADSPSKDAQETGNPGPKPKG
jgi:hypothetical protein